MMAVRYWHGGRPYIIFIVCSTDSFWGVGVATCEPLQQKGAVFMRQRLLCAIIFVHSR